MKKFATLFLLSMLLSCNSSRPGVDNNSTRISQVQYGEWTYAFKQGSDSEACYFYQKTEREKISFIELNHSGDRDDKVPRKVAALPKSLSKQKSAKHVQRLEVKICYTNAGKVVALRYPVAENQNVIEQALFDITFENRVEDACVECMTSYFYYIQ